jgi:hypothetical protein
MSYAEAVERVVEEDGSRVRDPERISRKIESDRNNVLNFSKCFVLQDLKVNHKGYMLWWVAAAEKYLGLRDFTA